MATLRAVRSVGWIGLGVLVAVLMFALLPQVADATPPKSYLQVGLLDKNWSSGWHYSNYGKNTSLDYIYYTGSPVCAQPWPYNCSAGHSTYLYFTGSGLQRQPFKIFQIIYCKGVEARIYQEGHIGEGAYYKGEARFLHINPRAGVNGLVPSSNFTWLGPVHGGPEVQGCGWIEPHLHQDAEVSYFTPFYTNWYGNHPWTYSHTICWSGSCP